jgi:hypothetical protein
MDMVNAHILDKIIYVMSDFEYNVMSDDNFDIMSDIMFHALMHVSFHGMSGAISVMCHVKLKTMTCHIGRHIVWIFIWLVCTKW